VAEARGKKTKKARWQLSLGIKEVVFAGLGAAGLMMMSFALGTLAGRGDIYRVMHNWGIVGPETVKAVPAAQPPPAVPPATQAATAEEPKPAAPPTQGAVAPSQPPLAAAGKPGAAAAPAPTATKKKGKESAAAKEHQAQQEELRRLQQEVARLSKFQNSFEPQQSKPGRAGSKEKAAPKTGPATVRVAMFRDGAKAKAKLAEMQKKGDKVTLKEGKDQEGPYFVIYRQTPGKQPEARTAASQKKKPADARQ
jgi:hypothetical protein